MLYAYVLRIRKLWKGLSRKLWKGRNWIFLPRLGNPGQYLAGVETPSPEITFLLLCMKESLCHRKH